MIKLRDYQETCLTKAYEYFYERGGNSGIWHVATGGGKTVMTTHFIDRYMNPQQGKRTIIVGGVNRVLNFQMLENLRKHFPYIRGNYVSATQSLPLSGLVMGQINQVDARVVVGSIQTLVVGVDLKKLSKPTYPLAKPITPEDFDVDRLGNVHLAQGSTRPYLVSERIDQMLAQGGLFDLWVHDEAHHAPADGSVYIIGCLNQISDLLGVPRMKIIGNTATPARADDRGLHTIFETVIDSYPIAWMQRHGYLVDFDEPKRILIDTVEMDDHGNGSVADERQTIRYVDNWAEIVAQGILDEMRGRKMFGYWSQYNGTTHVEDSIYVTKVMNEFGIRAVHIDGQKCIDQNGDKLPKSRERDLLAMLGLGEIDIINNVGVLTEGVDVPEVDGIVLGKRISSDNPVLLTQIIGRGLRLAQGKSNLKILDVTGQQLVINSIADLTGYTVDPTSGNFQEEIDIPYLMQMFKQLWSTRKEDIVKWGQLQKRFKTKTVDNMVYAVLNLDAINLSDTEVRALKDCVEFLLDEDKLLAGTDLKDVRQTGNVRGVNATYELTKIVHKSDGNWYADNRSAMMSISVSNNDSFVIVPPNHTYARIAERACNVLLSDDAHPLKQGKSTNQISKMAEFFNKAQDLFQNFTVWHMTGAYYNMQNKHPLWVMENEALDVLETDAMAYARDNIEDYVAKFGDKKGSRSWEKHAPTLKQQTAVAQLLGCSVADLPDDVAIMTKGPLSRFINHTAAVKYLSSPKSAISRFEEAIKQIEEIV